MRKVVVALTLMVAGLWQSAAFAGDGPSDVVRARQSQVTALLKQGHNSAAKQKIEALFDAFIDYDALAKQSLDRHWAERSQEERAEFTKILRQLVRAAYKKSLDKTLDYEIRYRGESKVQGGVLVKSVAIHRTDKRKEPIAIDYVLHQVGSDWRVFDIVTEGSSLVGNYRNQFRRVIKKDGFGRLMELLRKKLKKES